MKGPVSHHKPHPLSLAVRNTMTGATLVELLLVAGVIVSGTAIVLAVAHNTQVQGKRSQAQKDVQALQSRLLAGYRNQSNFDDITTDSARADGLFPSSMLDPVDGQPRTPWGGAITIAGVSSPGSSLNDSLVVALEDVPGRDCVETASSLASGFSDIRVNGISVGAGQALDVGRLAEACSGRSGNRLELVWNNPNASVTSGWCAGDGTYETRSLTCPPGQLGTIHESRLLSCPDLYADAVGGPWTEVANTCAPECVVPNPAVQTQERAGPSCPAGQLGEIVESRTLTYSCPAPTGSPNIDYSAWTVSSNTCAPICEAPMPETDSRTLRCPTGQLGEIIEEQVTTYICPAPTGSPTSSKSPWTVVSNTCAPECVAPPALVEPENGTGSCPATQVTPSGSKTYARSRTATTTYTCPAPTGDYEAEPTTYTSWSPSASQACAPACVLPSPNNQTDRETRTGTQTLSCPPGQLGEIRQSQPQERTRTRTASCPAPTGNPTWGSWTSWTSWTGTGSWTTTANTCANECVLPNPSTQTRAGTSGSRTLTEDQSVTVYEDGSKASRNVACPVGQLGQIREERPTRRSRSATQTRTQPQTRTTTQTRTATCPAPTGNPTWGSWSSPGAPHGPWTNSGNASAWSAPKAPYGNWSGYSQYGSWTQVSNTCAPACVLPNPSTQTRAGTPGTRSLAQTQTVTVYEDGTPATRTQACPAGQLGEVGQERPTRRSRTATQNRTQPQTRTTTQTRTATCPAPTGNPTWGSWSSPGAPYGSWTNSGNATSWSTPGAPYGSWSGYSQYGSWITVSSTCAPACVLPNPSTQTRAGTPGTRNLAQTQKVTVYEDGTPATRTQACPAGQLGQIGQERPTRRSREATQHRTQPQTRTTTQTRTATCPAPIGNPTWGSWSSPGAPYGSWTNSGNATSWSTPGAPYGSWSGYSQYGSWTTVSNTCAPACVLPNPSTQTRAGTPGTRNLAQTQTVTVYQDGTPVIRTVNSCPAGQYGQLIQQRPTRRSRTATQSRTQPQTRTTTQTRTATCPAPTGNPTWGSWSSPGAPYGSWTNSGNASSWSSPGAPYGSWSGYSQHGSWSTTSTKCTNCPAPNSNHATGHRWNGTYTQNCSAGQYGIITRERQQERKQTRSYNCPAGTGTLPSPTDTWGSYYNNGVTRLVSNTCKTCPSLSPDSQSTIQTGSQWVNSGDCQQREQTRTRTGTRTRSRSYSCPSGTTSLPPISYGSWSNYSYGSWGGWSNTNNYRNRSNSGSQSEPYSQCPMGQTLVNPGSRTRTWTCSNGSKSYGNWQITSFPQCCPPGPRCQIQ